MMRREARCAARTARVRWTGAPLQERVVDLFAITPTLQRIEIGRLGDNISADFMNRQGSVVGSYARDDGTLGSFFWSIDTGLVDIGPIDAPEVVPTALSANDFVVGFRQSVAGAVGFMWTLEDGVVTIPSLGGDRTFPTAVNTSGLVAGFGSTSKKGTHSFAWTRDGGLVDLGTLNGGSSSHAQIVIEDGTIVGSSDTRGKQQRAFVWTQATGMVELPSLGGTFDNASAANASGVLGFSHRWRRAVAGKGRQDGAPHPDVEAVLVGGVWKNCSQRRQRTSQAGGQLRDTSPCDRLHQLQETCHRLFTNLRRRPRVVQHDECGNRRGRVCAIRW